MMSEKQDMPQSKKRFLQKASRYILEQQLCWFSNDTISTILESRPTTIHVIIPESCISKLTKLISH